MSTPMPVSAALAAAGPDRLTVVKRDGSNALYDPRRMRDAIRPAWRRAHDESVDEASLVEIVAAVDAELHERYAVGDHTVQVREIESTVEQVLTDRGHDDVAEQYVTYRLAKAKRRAEATSVEHQVGRLADAEVVRENANKDSRVFHVQRDRMAGSVAKAKGLAMLPPRVADAHVKGQIHFHDLDYSPYTPFQNCDLPDFEGMLADGFMMGNASIEAPKSVGTAAAVLAQIIVAISSAQYGGITVETIDRLLAPYAEKTYAKHLADSEDYIYDQDIREEFARNHTVKDVYDAVQGLVYNLNTTSSTQGQTPFISLGFGLGTSWFEQQVQKALLAVQMKGLGAEGRTPIFPKLIFTLKRGVNLDPGDPNYDIKQQAIACATRRMYPDVINYENIVKITGSYKTAMGCVRGAETVTWRADGAIYANRPIESLWAWAAERYAVKVQPNGRDEYIDLPAGDVDIKDSHTGRGEYVPCLRVIRNRDQSFVDVTLGDGGLIVATPDHPFATERGRVLGANLVAGDRIPLAVDPDALWPLAARHVTVTGVESSAHTGFSYDVTTASDFFDVSGIVSHNCRSFLSAYADPVTGEQETLGRMNLGVVTVNLPRIALETRGSLTAFWTLLDERLEIAHEALRFREARVREVLPENAPILYKSGGFARLEDGAPVGHLFDHGRATLSLGYIGLYEVGAVFFGHRWETDPEAKEFTLSILAHMRDLARRWNATDFSGTDGLVPGAAISVYSTPSESLTDRFARLDHEKFGPIPDVTDKGNGRVYYVNSFHLDTRLGEADGWTPFAKLDFERDYAQYTSGGFIHYTEWPNVRNNPRAVEAVWDYAYDHGIGYMGVNVPIDRCFRCGYEGEFVASNDGFTCPACGNTGAEDPGSVEVIRRVCGYLSEPVARGVAKGRQHELASRVNHTAGSGDFVPCH